MNINIDLKKLTLEQLKQLQKEIENVLKNVVRN